MVIISVIKTTNQNGKENKKNNGIERSIKRKQAKTNHEFNNFATHYHMLISKHIHVNKQVLFFLPSYYIKSFVRQFTAQTTNFFFSLNFDSFFAEDKKKKTKAKKPMQNQYKPKLSREYEKNEKKKRKKS